MRPLKQTEPFSDAGIMICRLLNVEYRGKQNIRVNCQHFLPPLDTIYCLRRDSPWFEAVVGCTSRRFVTNTFPFATIH